MLRELIIQVLREDSRFSNLYLGEQGNVYDLVIVPIITLVEDYMEGILINSEIDKLDISNYRDMGIEDLIRLARTSLANIPEEVASRGELTLYFGQPVTWSIEAGTLVTGNGVTFQVSDGYYLSSNMSDYTYIDGYYQASVPLRIVNEYGTAALPNSLGSIDGAPQELVRISHGEIRSGLERYTPEMIYHIIRGSTMTRQFMSHSGIYYNLITNIPNIRRVVTVAPSDDLMKRDTVFNVTPSIHNLRTISDFSGRIRGWNNAGELVVYNVNRAFPVYATETDLEIFIDSVRQEVNQDMYLRLLPYNTEYHIELSTSNILYEDFSASSEVGDITRLIVSNADVNDRVIEIDNTDGFEVGMMVKIIGDRPVYNVIEDIDETEITLINNLGTNVTENVSTIITVETPGYYIGNNWFKGEHLMTLGRVPNESTIMVINNTLVMGDVYITGGKNILKDAVMVMGYDKVMTAIYSSLKIDFIKMDQRLSAVRGAPPQRKAPDGSGGGTDVSVIPIIRGGHSDHK